MAKFSKPFWTRSFAEWGYPGWFVYAIGALEFCGAVGVLFPCVAHYAASGLGVIMCGALYTVLANEHRLGWGTPVTHLVVLAIIVVVRSGILIGSSKNAEPN